MGLFSWIGKKVSSRWHDIWDDGYQFGDIFRSINAPIDGIVSGAVNDIAEAVSDVLTSDKVQNVVDKVQDTFDDIGTGLENTWYKYTGQAHLTDEYQHEEELANTVNQRTAEDMVKAGLSKFGLSGVSAGTPNATNGLTLLDSISKAQQIKAQGLALKEHKYNFGIAKKLGIRTGDKNVYAPLIALAKGLFGLDVDDIPEEGLIPYLIDMLKDGIGSSDGNGSSAGAFADAVGSAMVDSAKASPASSPTSLVELAKGSFSLSPYTLVELPKVPFDPSKGILKLGSSEKSVPTPSDVASSDSFDLQNTALKIHHDALYDELGAYAVGQAKPLSVQSFYNKYVSELIKEGFEKSHAMGIVSSWIKKMMDDLGYTYDKNDKLWFYDH